MKDRLATDMLEIHEGGPDVRAEALAEWKKDTPDAVALHARVDERVEAYRRLLHQAVDGAIEIHGELSPEQRVQIAELVEERMQRFER